MSAPLLHHNVLQIYTGRSISVATYSVLALAAVHLPVFLTASAVTAQTVSLRAALFSTATSS